MSELVSVIIPAYNAEDFISTCLNSIVNGTYSNIEVIVINDGSADDTARICDEYARENTNVCVVHTENSGVSAARNKGLELARGEYIMFVDADDVISRDCIERLYNAAIQSGAELTAGRSIRYDRELPDFEKANDGEGAISVITEEYERIRLSADTRFLSVWAKLFSKKVLDGAKFVVGKKINEDAFFVFEALLKCTKIATVDHCVYGYRHNPNSASMAAFSKKFYDILYFRDEKVRILKERYPEYTDLADMVSFRSNIDLLNKMASSKSGYTKQELVEARRAVLKTVKGFVSKSKKERIRLFLIKYAFWAYKLYMQRNSL